MTAPIQAAAARADDPHRAAPWAGAAFRHAKAASAANIVGELVG